MQANEFRDWLRARLDERGWTNSDLERASGVSNSIIWRWQTNPPRRPTPANLMKIAPHLGASYEELMRLCGYLPGAFPADATSVAELDPELSALLAEVEAGWRAMDERAREMAQRGTRALFAIQHQPKGASTRHRDGSSTPRSGDRRILDRRAHSGDEPGTQGSVPTVYPARRPALAGFSLESILAYAKRLIEPSSPWAVA